MRGNSPKLPPLLWPDIPPPPHPLAVPRSLQIGRRALLNRFLPFAGVANSILDKKEGEKEHQEEENSGKIPAGNRVGVAAVLTLLVDNKEAAYSGVLGRGWGIDGTLAGEGWAGTGPVMWEEIVVCEGQGYRGGSQGGEDGEAAWREASEGGAVKLVSFFGRIC